MCLQTATTRSQHRLLFVETRKSVAGHAFFRWLNVRDLAEEHAVAHEGGPANSEGHMTNDEWRVRGIEYVATNAPAHTGVSPLATPYTRRCVSLVCVSPSQRRRSPGPVVY